jgi:hypothetical protein
VDIGFSYALTAQNCSVGRTISTSGGGPTRPPRYFPAMSETSNEAAVTAGNHEDHDPQRTRDKNYDWWLVPVRTAPDTIRLVFITNSLHTTVPNKAPTPAVSPMASAPQNVTRIAPRAKPAPPTPAANAPKSARNSSEVPGTSRIRLLSGAKVLVRRGIAAPTAKLRADANAAWIGRARRVSVMPSSSRACAPIASWAMS